MGSTKNINLAYCGSDDMKGHRLFCFPFAGGGASIFAPWNKLMQKRGIQIMPIQLPGRENRYTEKYENDITVLAREVAEGVKAYLDRPFSVFGHSMGGCLAYEFVKQIESQFNEKPNALFVSCTSAPRVIAQSIFGEDSSKETKFELSEDIFMELVNRYNGMDVNLLEIKEYYEYFVPILKRDFMLVGNYHPLNNDKVSPPIHILYGIEDPDMTEENIAPWQEYGNDVRYKKMEGAHFYIKDKIEEVCDYIASNTVF